MNRFLVFAILIFFAMTFLCSCESGPYSAPLNQTTVNILKVEFLSGNSENAQSIHEYYSGCIINTLEQERLDEFVDELLKVEFYLPMLDSARLMGDVAIRIVYQDGSSDLIGISTNYYVDREWNVLRGGRYCPDDEAYENLVSSFLKGQIE